MNHLPWMTILAWGIAAFFLLGAFINTFATNKVEPEYRRWGYPDWFHFVSGGLELIVALLLPAMMTRLFGATLGAAIMVAAVATVCRHREYRRAVPPIIVLVLLAIVGAA